ncbi:MAG: site-2 protease family protein [Bacteroidota bacterium]
MNMNGLRFTLLGFPVEIKPTFLILTVLLYSWQGTFEGALELTVWAFIALLAHEIGHALAFRRFGIPARVELYMLGGLAIPMGGGRLSNGQQIWVSFSGPLGSFAIGGVFFLIAYLLGGLPALTMPGSQLLFWALWFSFGWGIINLIPIYPLDGGQILQAVLSYKRDWDAVKISAYISIGICGLLLLYVLMNFSLWNLILVVMLLFTNIRRLQGGSALGGGGLGNYYNYTPAPKGSSQPKASIDRLTRKLDMGFYEEALEGALEVLQKTRRGNKRLEALRIAATVYYKKGQLDDATEFAEQYPAYEEQVPELKVALLRYQGKTDEAAEYARKTYQQHPSAGLGEAYVKLLAHRHQHQELNDFMLDAKAHSFHDRIAEAAADALFDAKDFAVCRVYAEPLFERTATGRHAYQVASAYALESQHEQAIQWLVKAKDAGLDVRRRLRYDRNFDDLRGLVGFKDLMRFR